MATKEFIINRITGKEKELEKLNKKLARIRKVENQNWEDPNPYLYNPSDLKWCIKDIEKAEEQLNKYKAELQTIIEKENSRNVKVIIDFLQMWQDMCHEWYMPKITEYFTEKNEVHRLYQVAESFTYSSPERKENMAKFEVANKQFDINRKGRYENRTFINRWGREETTKVKVEDGKYECIKEYMVGSLEAAEDHLKADLKAEAERKYDDIINRTNEAIGEIVDASGLTIDAKCNLNGIITGAKGSVRVETIGAGGYNIQCFHFRTLIHKI